MENPTPVTKVLELSKKMRIVGIDCVVKFPNVGQWIDIDNAKMVFSAGRYGDLMKANSSTTEFTLNVIDALAYFSVLIPEFRAKIKVESYDDLDYKLAKTLSSDFTTAFWPWFVETRSILDSETASALKDINEKN